MIGSVLFNKYSIVEALGRGGTSTVYLAENIILSNYWAIKVLSKENAWLSAELDEIDMLKNLSHPMLPRIADMAEDNDNYYIIMDYIEGTNVSDLLNNTGIIPQNTLVNWTLALLDVLDYLHKRNPPVIYRDLKPGNLIVDDSGRLRLVDFGSARFHNQEADDDTVYIGTRGYAAPEQYGAGQSDHRTDLYNLGMTLFHLATGTHPISIPPETMKTELKLSGITNAFASFILKLTQASPEDRFQSCSEAMAYLDEIQRHRGLYSRKTIKGSIKSGKRRFKGIIGIGSILPSCGVTSFALSLGLYLSKNNIKSTLIELNSSGDFDRLRDVFDSMGWLRTQSKIKMEALNLVLYPNASEFGEISRKGIDATILDLGHINTENKLRELNRADIKLILCPGVPWKYKLVSEWLDKNLITNSKELIFLVSNTQGLEKLFLKKTVKGSPIINYPFNGNVISPNRSDLIQIDKIFKEICHVSGYA
ncbi:MAG: serine/threonine protein kinase [Acetivibrionales bacterium]|jgi:serine/threonine protein kinase